MIRFIQYYTKTREPAEDIAQDCWYTILEKLDEIELKISFEAWAFAIAKGKSIDWIRKQQRLRDLNSAAKVEYANDMNPGTEIADEMEAQIEKIQTGIHQLQPTQKIALRMFYLENLSLQEISEALNISMGTVKSRLFYARENLKKIISTQTGSNHEKRRNR